MKASGTQASGTQANGARATTTARVATPTAPDPMGLIELQRVVGNRAVRELLAAPGGVNEAAPARGNLALLGRRPEANLTDHRSAPRLRRVCACGGASPCTACRDGEALRRQSEPAAGLAREASSGAVAPVSVHETLRAGGAPLPAGVSARMARRFGRDFSRVRVHTGARAEASADAVGARAYTVGHHIVFARGEFAPGSTSGERLLAHELAHTIQQDGSGSGLQRQIAIGRSDDPEEAAADRMAEVALRGDPVADAPAQAGDRLLAHELAYTLQGGAPALRREPSDNPLLDVGTGDPSSLTKSIHLHLSDPQTIQMEIEAIRRWLAARHLVPEDETTKHLRDELARLEAHLWDEFAPLFNKEFVGVLNVFYDQGARLAPLTPARLKALFTDTQRQKLRDFIITRRIPDRVFNSTDRGTASAQERLLLSAHILANGIYRPHSFDQWVHARSCYHWVQIVHHYAGATPRGSNSRGVKGTFDPKGAAVITTGKHTFIHHEKYVHDPDLPEAESPSGTDPQRCDTHPLPDGTTTDESPGGTQPPQCGIGPLHEGTPHADAAKAAKEADPTKPSRFTRQPSLPFNKFDDLKAGDWLWYYVGSRSDGGGHSAIFSHWRDREDRRHKHARYRIAIVWSLRVPPGGVGAQHPARLGDQFVPNPGDKFDPFVTPITHVSRVTRDTAPATFAAAILPGPTDVKALKRLKENNETHIKHVEKKLKGTVNRNKLEKWIQDKNESFMVSLEARLDPGQRGVLTSQVNVGDDLQALIRLYQLLRTLHANASLLDKNMAVEYAKLDPAYKAAKEKKEDAEAAAAKELGAIDVHLGSVKIDTREKEQQRAELDMKPRIVALQHKEAELHRKISNMKAGPDREKLKMLRKDVSDQVKQVRALHRQNASALAKVNADLAKLVTRKSKLDATAKALKARAAVAMPFGLVHPGNLKNQDLRHMTGKLADIDIEWDEVVDPAASASPPTTPMKL